LQALSKRIHYGKFVAEAKFRESPKLFEDAIRAKVSLMVFFFFVACRQSIDEES
jgi:chorismate mutase